MSKSYTMLVSCNKLENLSSYFELYVLLLCYILTITKESTKYDWIMYANEQIPTNQIPTNFFSGLDHPEIILRPSFAWILTASLFLYNSPC